MRLNSDLISERRAHSFDPLAGRAGDGLCTLEVFQTYDEILRENMMLLQRMAKRMLSCITDAGHRGGIMTGVGMYIRNNPSEFPNLTRFFSYSSRE